MRPPTRVELLRVVTAAEAYLLYAVHAHRCPAIGARGKCDCGLDEARGVYDKARRDARIPVVVS